MTVDVTSPAHYDDLLAKSGLNSQGENDAASVAELATGSIGAADAHAEDTSKQRRILFITIVGGLILSQLLTLYTTPVVYLAFDRLRLRIQGKRRDTLDHQAGLAPSAAD